MINYFWIKKDRKINGKRVNKDFSIFCGDEVSVYLSDALLENKNTLTTSLNIVYEDDNILLVNKPNEELTKKILDKDITFDIVYFADGYDTVTRLITEKKIAFIT